MPVYNVRAPDGRVFKVNAPENAKQEDLFAFVEQQLVAEALRQEKQNQTGLLQTFGQGISRGAGRLASTVTDVIPGMVGSALGFEDYARQQLDESRAKEEARQAQAPTLYPSFRDVRGVGTGLGYLAETLGEQVPNLLSSLIPGVAGAKIGAKAATAGFVRAAEQEAVKRQLAGEAAQEFTGYARQALQQGAQLSPLVQRGAQRGALAGAFLGSYAQTAPEVFQNIAEDSGQLAVGASMIAGGVNAALDSILPYQLAQQLTGPMRKGIVEKLLEKSGMERGLLRSATAGIVRGVPTEGLTEGAQEAISIAAERFVNDNAKAFGSKEWERILESSIRGAVAGGGFGGIGGAIEGTREGMERKARYDEIMQQRQQRVADAEEAQRIAEQTQQEAVSSLTAPGEALTEQIKKQGLGSLAAPSVVDVTAPEGTVEQPDILKTISEAQSDVQQLEEKFAPTEAQKKAAEERRQKEQAAAVKAEEQQRDRLQRIGERAQQEAVSSLTAQGETLVKQGLGSLARGPSDIDKLAQEATRLAGQSGQKPLPPSTRELPSVITKGTHKNALGIGPSASIWNAIEGKDINDPTQANEVKELLDAYLDKNPAQKAVIKVPEFLEDPRFKTTTTAPQEAQNAGEPVAEASGESAGVVGESGRGAAPSATEQAEPSGVEIAGRTAGEPAVGESAPPAALTPEAPAEPAPAQPAVETPPAPEAQTAAESTPAPEAQTAAPVQDEAETKAAAKKAAAKKPAAKKPAAEKAAAEKAAAEKAAAEKAAAEKAAAEKAAAEKAAAEKAATPVQDEAETPLSLEDVVKNMTAGPRSIQTPVLVRSSKNKVGMRDVDISVADAEKELKAHREDLQIYKKLLACMEDKKGRQ